MSFQVCKIIWEIKIGEEDTDLYTITTPVQTGMIGLMRKLQEAAGRSYESAPLTGREYLSYLKRISILNYLMLKQYLKMMNTLIIFIIYIVGFVRNHVLKRYGESILISYQKKNLSKT